MASSRTEPLLPSLAAAEQASLGKLVALCVSLIATTVGAGVLSVPISFAYLGSISSGCGMLGAFGMLSAASMRFIDIAANRMNASNNRLWTTGCAENGRGRVACFLTPRFTTLNGAPSTGA